MSATPVPSPHLSEAIGSPVRLANEFSRILRDWLNPRQMAIVRFRNRFNRQPGVCHSHDFCDANMAMDAAFKHFGIDPCSTGIPDTDHPSISEEVETWWNDAWNLAKSAGFQPLPEHLKLKTEHSPHPTP